MNKIVIAVVGAVVLSVATVAYAGGACCPAKRAKAEQQDPCGGFLSKLNLTDDQKAKVNELKQECKRTGCTADSHTKFMEGLKGVLTAEQLEQCKVECAKVKVACATDKKE